MCKLANCWLGVRVVKAHTARHVRASNMALANRQLGYIKLLLLLLLIIIRSNNAVPCGNMNNVTLRLHGAVHLCMIEAFTPEHVKRLP